MEERWLRQGPPLSELASGIAGGGGRRKRIALIIPTIRRKEALGMHLHALTRQTSKDFDVIIVYGAGERPAEGPDGLGCVHIRSAEDFGSAGAFYAGESYALGKGYEKIVLADDDCIPVSADLIERLDEATDTADIALPRLSYGDGDGPAPGNLLPQYGCIRSSALRSVGLTYAPFFFGGEDIELMERLVSAKARIAFVEQVAAHPQILSNFLTQRQKIFYYVRGGIMSKYLNGSFMKALASNIFFVYGAAYLALIDRGRALALFDAATMAAAMGFFRCDRYPELPLAEAAPPQERVLHIRRRIRWTPETTADLSSYARLALLRAAGILQAAPDSIAAFGKDAVFHTSVGIGAIPALLTARRSFIENGGRTYLICDNRFFYLAPLKAACLAAILPLAFASAFCLTCAGFIMKELNGADSLRYGLARIG